MADLDLTPIDPSAVSAAPAVPPGRPRQLLTAALMLAMAVVALEGTVVTTAMPSVVGQLQGLTLYPWVFSIYLLSVGALNAPKLSLWYLCSPSSATAGEGAGRPLL